MGNCLSCILGDSEEAYPNPNSLNRNTNTKYNYSSKSIDPKAKFKSDRIDAYIEKQASEQNNVVKILLLGTCMIDNLQSTIKF